MTLREAVFTWNVGTDGYTEIIKGRAPIRAVLFEIARQAYHSSATQSRLPLESQDLPTDAFLERFFRPLSFSEDGSTIVRTGDYNVETLFDMDYVKGLSVKTSVIASRGKILFCGRLYDANHLVNHEHVLRLANMSLEARV